MTVRGDRQLIAAVIGVDFANSIADDQLPALVHAVEEDAMMVAQCARQASRKGVDNPPSLLMWLIRERKHTDLIKPGDLQRLPQPELIPPAEPRTPEQEHHYSQWKRIWNTMKRNRELRELVIAWCDLYPDPTPEQARETRDALIAVIDEMEKPVGA